MDTPLTPLTPANAATARAALPPGMSGMTARLALLPLRARLMLGLAAAGLVAVAATLLLWSQQGNFAMLFGGLAEKDAGSVTTQLEQLGVPYKLSGAGTIMVPADQVLGLRMKLAQLNLPRGTTSGNELLDVSQFGTTPSKERSTLNRALQGELERSVMALDAVQSARVHLSVPPATAFFHDQPKPSASVLLTLHAGRTLDRNQIAGIVFLVVRAVAGMNPRDVAVLDQSGALLSTQAGQGGDAGGLDGQQLQHVRQIETQLVKRLHELLEPTVGRDNLRATVTAEVDFNQLESTSEEYKPNQKPDTAAVRSSRSTESNGATPGTASGIPGAASNQPAAAATAPLPGASAPSLHAAGSGSGTSNARRESQTQFELDHTVAVRRNAVGTLRRVSAAVLINHRSVTDSKGKTSQQPVAAEEIDKINALVQQAIGFNAERGDSVKVVNMPFVAELLPKPEELPFWRQSWLIDLVRAAAVPAALVLVALMLVLAVARPALRQVQAPPEANPPPQLGLDEVVDSETPTPAQLSLASDATQQALAQESNRQQLQLDNAKTLAKNNPAAVANLVRDWMGTASA